MLKKKNDREWVRFYKGLNEALRKNERLKKRKLQMVEEDRPDEDAEEPTA